MVHDVTNHGGDDDFVFGREWFVMARTMAVD